MLTIVMTAKTEKYINLVYNLTPDVQTNHHLPAIEHIQTRDDNYLQRFSTLQGLSMQAFLDASLQYLNSIDFSLVNVSCLIVPHDQ